MGALAFALQAEDEEGERGISGSPFSGGWGGENISGCTVDDEATQVRQMRNLQLLQCHTPAPFFNECPPFQHMAGLPRISIVQEPEQYCAMQWGGA
jgi:hypothetical protein